jgi:protein-S-isoprenylcysteine O-methyltransferase Ste14
VAPPVQIVVGIVTMAVGMVITFAGQIQMGPSWRVGVRAGERTALVTHGLFRLARNPIFSGVITTAIGAVILVPRPAMALAAVGSILGIQIQVRRVEEPHLETTHGSAYTDYTRRVGRFVPGVGKKG